MPGPPIPLLLIGGFIDVGPGLLVLIGLIACALIGGHVGMNSIAGIFCRNMWRSDGAGWATSMGKIRLHRWSISGRADDVHEPPDPKIYSRRMAICPATMWGQVESARNSRASKHLAEKSFVHATLSNRPRPSTTVADAYVARVQVRLSQLTSN